MMRTVSELRQIAVAKLDQCYDAREAVNIVSLWFQVRLGLSRTELILNANEEVPFETFFDDLDRLLKNEPIQHILGSADFYGLELMVNEHTLIPRPETEELVACVLQILPKHTIRILDVGTGSGAIALALKANRPDCEVVALDWSKEALEVARKNSERNDLKVEFLHLDALSMPLPEADLVVSNPPYIPVLERASMEQNVVQFEPEMALFVPQEDPLLFYRQMAKQANSVAFEIHHDKGEEMRSMLVNFGYTEIVLQKDLQSKDRIITAHHESRRSY